MSTVDTISAYYQRMLQREPDAAGLDSWVHVVDSGMMTLAEVRAAFVASPEAQASVLPIIRFYQAAFNRVPDPEGLAGWTAALRNGMTLEQIAEAFVTCDEFKASHGAGTEITPAYVTSLYTNILGRLPDPEGFNAWLNSGVSQSEMLLAFVNCPEAIARAAGPAASYLDSCATGAEDYQGSLYEGVDLGNATFQLTAGIDDLTGTAGNDLFKAPWEPGILGQPVATLGSFDAVDGGAGRDTLKWSYTDANLGVPNVGEFSEGGIAPKLTSVEVVEVTAINGYTALDLLRSTGVEEIRMVDSLDAHIDIRNATSLEKVSVEDSYGAGLSIYAADGTLKGPRVISVSDSDSAHVTVQAYAGDSDFEGPEVLVADEPEGTAGGASITGLGTISIQNSKDAYNSEGVYVGVRAYSESDDSDAPGSARISGLETISVAGSDGAQVDIEAEAYAYYGDAGDARVEGPATISVSGSEDAEVYVGAYSEAWYGGSAGNASVTGLGAISVADSESAYVEVYAESDAYYGDAGDARVEGLRSISITGSADAEVHVGAYSYASEGIAGTARVDGLEAISIVDSEDARVEIDGLTSEELTLTVSNSDGAEVDIENADEAELGLKTLTVTGDSSLVLEGGLSRIETVDASGFEGDLTATITSEKDVTYAGAAGVDDVVFGSGSSVVHGGSGSDKFALSANGKQDVFAYETAGDAQIAEVATGDTITIAQDGGSLETITGFVAGEDEIDLSAFGFSADRMSAIDVSAKIALDTDLTSVDGLFGGENGTSGAAFASVGGDTYVFIDADKDGNFTASSDGMLKLAGVTGLQATDDFVFLSGAGPFDLAGVSFTAADAAEDFKFEPNVNLDAVVSDLIEELGAEGTLEVLTVNGSKGDAFKLVWDYLDDNYSYYNTVVNNAVIDLGIAYAKYLKAGGEALNDTIVKFAPDDDDDGNTPERSQTLHDNLLGNLDELSIKDKFDYDTTDAISAADVFARIEDAGLGELLGEIGNYEDGRPIYGGYEDQDPAPTATFDQDYFFA